MIYFIEAEGIGRIKIGFCRDRRRVYGRLAELQEQAPAKLAVLISVEGSLQLEHQIHHAFRHHRAIGEWFHDNPDLRSLIAMLGDDIGGAEQTIREMIGRMELDALKAERLTDKQRNEFGAALDEKCRIAVATFCRKHGTPLTCKITGVSKDTILNWRNFKTKPVFTSVVQMLRYDRKPFVGTPFVRETAEQPHHDRLDRVEREIDAIRRETVA